MSVRAVHFNDYPSVNLLPAHYRLAMRRRGRIKVWSVVVSIYTVGVGASWLMGGGWGMLASGASGDPVADQLRTVNGKIEMLTRDRNEARERVGLARRTLDAAKAAGHHPDWSILLQLMAKGAAPNIVFERFELRTRAPAPPPADPNGKPGATKPAKPPVDADIPDLAGYTLQLEGIAASQVDVVRYAASLEGLGVFESVAIVGTHPRDSVSADAPGPHLVSFQVACTLSDEGAAAHIRASSEKPADTTTGAGK